MLVIPEAIVDALAVVGFLSGEATGPVPPKSRRPVSAGEVHLFAYLGCLLGLYRRRPTSAWGYEFIRSIAGIPFADVLSVGLESLKRSGLIELTQDDGYLLTERGRASLEQLGALDRMRERVSLVRTGCDAAITIPPAMVRLAVAEEPGMQTALHRRVYAMLGSDGSREALYNQFGTLRRVLGPDMQELLIPAIAWLTYLVEVVRKDLPETTITEPDAADAN